MVNSKTKNGAFYLVQRLFVVNSRHGFKQVNNLNKRMYMYLSKNYTASKYQILYPYSWLLMFFQYNHWKTKSRSDWFLICFLVVVFLQSIKFARLDPALAWACNRISYPLTWVNRAKPEPAMSLCPSASEQRQGMGLWARSEQRSSWCRKLGRGKLASHLV